MGMERPTLSSRQPGSLGAAVVLVYRWASCLHLPLPLRFPSSVPTLRVSEQHGKRDKYYLGNTYANSYVYLPFLGG